MTTRHIPASLVAGGSGRRRSSSKNTEFALAAAYMAVWASICSLQWCSKESGTTINDAVLAKEAKELKAPPAETERSAILSSPCDVLSAVGTIDFTPIDRMMSASTVIVLPSPGSSHNCSRLKIPNQSRHTTSYHRNIILPILHASSERHALRHIYRRQCSN